MILWSLDFINGGIGLTLAGLGDSDYAGDPRSRKSTTGGCFFLFGRRTRILFHWLSALQKAVASSTTEAEALALHKIGLYLLWLLTLMEQVFPRMQVRLLSDSQCAISVIRKGWSKSLRCLKKTGQVSIAWLNEYLAGLLVKLWGRCNCADIFTKAMTQEDQLYYERFMGLIEYSRVTGRLCTCERCACSPIMHFDVACCLNLVESSDSKLCNECSFDYYPSADIVPALGTVQPANSCGCSCQGNRQNLQPEDKSHYMNCLILAEYTEYD